MEHGLNNDRLNHNTQILEQYRNRISILAQQGKLALNDEIDLAQLQLRSAEAEWEQAKRAIQEAHDHYDTAKEELLKSEELLNQTIAEENDTLLAAQSVQTMIDDTAAMIAAADKDTAIIMQKAGPVLQDTLIRTQEKLQAKTLQRQEAEALLQRLEARQKCFTYLIAKAERLFRERNLDKLQARLRCDIYADESYLLQLVEEKKQLQQQLAEQKALLDEQTLLLQLAQEHYNAAINEERELRSKAQQDFICAKEKGKQALADIDALVHARDQGQK